MLQHNYNPSTELQDITA